MTSSCAPNAGRERKTTDCKKYIFIAFITPHFLLTGKKGGRRKNCAKSIPKQESIFDKHKKLKERKITLTKHIKSGARPRFPDD